MIRKPSVVKGIPTLIVRALPTLYYYGRYADDNVSTEAKQIFDCYADYLAEAVKKMSQVIGNGTLKKMPDQILQLKNVESAKIEDHVFKLTQALSQICQDNKNVIQNEYKKQGGIKNELVELFCNRAQQTKILLVDNEQQAEWADGLVKRLSEDCYYLVDKTKTNVDNFSENIINNDFVVFASATPQSIHEDVEYLNTYQKPGLILGNLTKDKKLDQQTIRNGSWLKKRGYEVLYKIFSPLRLFTTIDKINVRYLLQGGLK